MSEACSGSCGSCASGSNCNEKLNRRLDAVKHKLLVMSGKGGVGKSTVAAALAVTLARQGLKVGLLDVDFHGPSQPTLFNLQHLRLEAGPDGVIPAEAGGIQLVSLGLLLENNDQAVIWRGPAKMSVLKELLEESNFGELDYLVLDFPPGTGDEVLSACQLIPGDKQALVVTTPQEVSLADCRKCLDFCRQLEVPVAGIVENMAGYVCPGCGARHALFSSGGGAALASQAQVPLLASLPLDPQFLQACDHGNLPEGLAASTPIREGLEQAVGALRNGTR
ncbi:Mrp/NBP35 family ATP-binding protein [Victivallis sp. Marseille-Q1083]|uniref:Mrp/NBP35 family ATP-binding protein n=1 Tax=Victivallis sp. Marseille-Q1083 TaxID=2717288 RepID=UPI00158F1073|nr:Mrp/NBP35 family ATP-binding protein [Victivallis sp. Marseille-Q1083]